MTTTYNINIAKLNRANRVDFVNYYRVLQSAAHVEGTMRPSLAVNGEEMTLCKLLASLTKKRIPSDAAVVLTVAGTFSRTPGPIARICD